jgi:hypothetical protein
MASYPSSLLAAKNTRTGTPLVRLASLMSQAHSSSWLDLGFHIRTAACLPRLTMKWVGWVLGRAEVAVCSSSTGADAVQLLELPSIWSFQHVWWSVRDEGLRGTIARFWRSSVCRFADLPMDSTQTRTCGRGTVSITDESAA